MPIYEFYCDDCGNFEATLRPMSRSSDGCGCFNCAAPMRRIFTPPALLNRQKPGSFKWRPDKLDAWDDRLAHLKTIEEKQGAKGLRAVRKEVGATLYNQTLDHKKANYG